MSDGYRDDGTGTEDWCVKRKTERERSRSLHLLRVTPAGGFVVPDRLLQGLQEGAGQAPPESDAVLAQLEKEGLA